MLTPKQVNFFKPLVDELKRRRHRVLCTSRSYGEAEELARLRNLELIPVGEHGGESLYGKLKASSERTRRLVDIVRKFQPDCLVNLSSPEASRVAFGLQVRNVGFSDSPHAEAVCRLTIPLMDTLMCPWIVPLKEFTRYGIKKNRILRYRALDPAMWIRDAEGDGRRVKRGSGASRGGEDYLGRNIDPAKKTITFRLEESKAAYYTYGSGRKFISLKFLDSLLRNFRGCNIIVLSRYADQRRSVRGGRFDNDGVIVPEGTVDGVSLLLRSDLFVGSGGTMNCEASLLGIPNISYMWHNILTNRFLFRKGVSFPCTNPDEMVRLARKTLTDSGMRRILRSRSRRLLSSMENPGKRILRVLEEKRVTR